MDHRRNWIRQKEAGDNTRAAAANLLLLQGIRQPVDFNDDLVAHPEYPKLGSLVDNLEECGYRVRVVQGECEEFGDI
ncbi:MAG: hypothetical protein ACKVQK_14445, partial [Burkholderiales bacterium]